MKQESCKFFDLTWIRVSLTTFELWSSHRWFDYERQVLGLRTHIIIYW